MLGMCYAENSQGATRKTQERCFAGYFVQKLCRNSWILWKIFGETELFSKEIFCVFLISLIVFLCQCFHVIFCWVRREKKFNGQKLEVFQFRRAKLWCIITLLTILKSILRGKFSENSERSEFFLGFKFFEVLLSFWKMWTVRQCFKKKLGYVMCQIVWQFTRNVREMHSSSTLNELFNLSSITNRIHHVF